MRKNHIPKVVFQLPSIGREASIFVKFLETAPEAWKNHIFRRHPALEEALGNETDTGKNGIAFVTSTPRISVVLKQNSSSMR